MENKIGDLFNRSTNKNQEEDCNNLGDYKENLQEDDSDTFFKIFGLNGKYNNNSNDADKESTDTSSLDVEYEKSETEKNDDNNLKEDVNLEGSEEMEEPKVVDEPTSKTDNNEEQPKQSQIKNLKLRITVGALALVLMGAAGFALYKTRPNRKVAKMDASEITTSKNSDNIKALTKIEGCLRLSKIIKEYQDDNSYITNLDIGTVEVNDGQITELTDEEYKAIMDLMNKLENASKKEKQTDNYKQMIKQFVGYSSKVNAYLVYYAPQLLNNIIVTEMDDDVEQVLEVTDEKVSVTYDYSSNTINIKRTDGGVGEASYSLTATGKVIDSLTEDLNKGTSSTTSIDSFVNDSTKTVLNMESTITKNSDGSLIVEYSKEINKELENRVIDTKLQMYRKLSQNNGKIRYGYLVPRDSIESSQSQEQTSRYVKTRTM